MSRKRIGDESTYIPYSNSHSFKYTNMCNLVAARTPSVRCAKSNADDYGW